MIVVLVIFFDLCRVTLDQHVPRKQKYSRGHHMIFVGKTISKEIVKRTKLRNKFLKDRTDENKKKIFVTAKLLCFTFAQNEKTEYYENLTKKCKQKQNLLENSKAFSSGQESV